MVQGRSWMIRPMVSKDAANEVRRTQLQAGGDPCSLLSKAEAGQSLQADPFGPMPWVSTAHTPPELTGCCHNVFHLMYHFTQSGRDKPVLVSRPPNLPRRRKRDFSERPAPERQHQVHTDFRPRGARGCVGFGRQPHHPLEIVPCEFQHERRHGDPLDPCFWNGRPVQGSGNSS